MAFAPVAFTAPRISGLYQVTSNMGFGSFGQVFGGVHLLTGAEVAIKVEPISMSSQVPMLPYETAVYKLLGNASGVPRLRWEGRDGGANVMVLDRTGPNLESLRRFCLGRFGLKTVVMLADQMISRMEFVHSRGLVFRDVKPDNFAMGLGYSSHMVHIFDFGLAKLYRDPSSGRHMPYREGRVGLGTPRYASANVHAGREQSRRDDIEALGNLFLYFYRGRLPWQGIFAPTVQDKLKRIGDVKLRETIPEALTDCPPEFGQYFQYCRGLDFHETPDYGFLRELMRKIMVREGWTYDNRFDWLERQKRAGTLLSDEYIVNPQEAVSVGFVLA